MGTVGIRRLMVVFDQVDLGGVHGKVITGSSPYLSLPVNL